MPVIHIPESVVCPLETHGGLPFVKAMVNGSEGLFLIDSGSPRLKLNHSFLKNTLQVPVNPQEHTMQIDRFAIGEWTADQLTIALFDGTSLEEQFGIELAGVMGFREWIHFNWIIDLPEKTLQLARKFQLNDEKLIGKARGRYVGHLPVFPVEIGSETYQVGIVTGFAGLAFDQGLKEQLAPHLLDPSATDSGSTLKYFSIAGRTLLKTPVIFADLGESDLPKGGYDAIIGTPLLAQGKVLLHWG